MKGTLSLITIVLALVFCTNVSAQKKIKTGHIDSQKLLSSMPGRDSAEAQLKVFWEELEETLVELNKEYEAKLQEYQADQAKPASDATKWSATTRQMKEQQIQDIQKRVQEFQQEAQQKLQKREAELLEPILKRAQDAINEVANENNFSHIFNINANAGFSNSLLYVSEPSVDILPLVKKKLGIE